MMHTGLVSIATASVKCFCRVVSKNSVDLERDLRRDKPELNIDG